MRLKSGSNLTRGRWGRQACVLRFEVMQKTFRLPVEVVIHKLVGGQRSAVAGMASER
jgi:hypothetical protein